MKALRGILLAACCFSIAATEVMGEGTRKGKARKPKATCGAAMSGEEAGQGPIYVRHWDAKEKATLDYRFLSVADLNGAIIWEVAEFFKTKKRTPIASELVGRLKKYKIKDQVLEPGEVNLLVQVCDNFADYASIPDALGDMSEILHVAVMELPGHFEKMRGDAGVELMRYFKNHLRLPTLAELASKEGFSSADELSIVVGDRAQFVDQARHSAVGGPLLLDTQNKIVRAFVRAMTQRDTPDARKVQNNTPEFDEIFVALLRTDTNKPLQVDASAERFGRADLARLIGGNGDQPEAKQAPARDFMVPVLFKDGIPQIEAETRVQLPNAFKSFHSDVVFPISRSEAARDAIEKKSGFLVTSVTAGIPTDPAMLAIFRHIAKKNDQPALVMPTNLVLEGLDQRLVNDPDVHVVTNTIENRHLRLWAGFPVMPKNQSPFQSTSQRKQFKAGQLSIIAHPQLALQVVPTSSNEIRPTIQIGTGSISEPLYPSRHPVQMRTAALAKNYHSNGFWMVQKADSQAGLTGEGVSNVWHPRFVEFKVDELTGGGRRVAATDMGVEYVAVQVGENEYRVEERRQDPKALVLGDVHVYVANHRLLQLYRTLPRRFPGLRYVIPHDLQDNLAINPHEWRKAMGLVRERFKTGDLDAHREAMATIQFVNSWMLEFPNLYMVKPYDNHGVWLTGLVDDPLAVTQNVINHDFLEELRAARLRGIRDPYEYLMTARHEYAASLPPAQRQQFEASTVFCVDPSRFRQLGDDDKFVLGPENRHIYLNFHGDAGKNGARGSVQSHASASEASVSGDSHVLALWGGFMNVGTSTRLKVGYNNKGYSSWTNGAGLIYPDGTRQLLVYQGVANQFEPTAGVPILSPELFFAGDSLQVRPTDNQLLPNAEVMDAHSQWLDILRGRLR